MKVFLSYARKDSELARRLAELRRHVGFIVWLAEEEITLGDNWAKKIGKALDDSDWMVILLSPGALQSDSLRQDIEFVLGSKKYADRVFSVFVGSTREARKYVPWILLELPHRQVESAKEFAGVVREIKALFSRSGMSHSHA
jgi:hypothetical protein